MVLLSISDVFSVHFFTLVIGRTSHIQVLSPFVDRLLATDSESVTSEAFCFSYNGEVLSIRVGGSNEGLREGQIRSGFREGKKRGAARFAPCHDVGLSLFLQVLHQMCTLRETKKPSDMLRGRFRTHTYPTQLTQTLSSHIYLTHTPVRALTLFLHLSAFSF